MYITIVSIEPNDRIDRSEATSQTQHSWNFQRSQVRREVNNSPWSLPIIVRVCFCTLCLLLPSFFPASIIRLRHLSLFCFDALALTRGGTCAHTRKHRHTDRGRAPLCGPLPFEVCIWGPWCHENLFWLEPHGNHLHTTFRHAALTVLITTTWQVTIAYYELHDF